MLPYGRFKGVYFLSKYAVFWVARLHPEKEWHVPNYIKMKVRRASLYDNILRAILWHLNVLNKLLAGARVKTDNSRPRKSYLQSK